jgi:hypothetical protein
MLLKRVYPRPSELVLLDAPAEVLHARKPEGTLEALRARRQEYLDLFEVLPRGIRMTVLDAGAAEHEVAAKLLRIAGRREPGAEGSGVA